MLITLGIIGVVAAMTLPTLIQNHRKQVVESRLSKFYSTINQAIQMAEVEYGDKTSWTFNSEISGLDFWELCLKPNLKYTKVEDIDSSGNVSEKFVYLPDGSGFRLSAFEINYFPDAKKYNEETFRTNMQLGKDNFRFAFYGHFKGDIYKYHTGKGVEPYTAHWNGNLSSLVSNSSYGCHDNGNVIPRGSYCTALIQQNGWKIPDNYPFKF